MKTLFIILTAFATVAYSQRNNPTQFNGTVNANTTTVNSNSYNNDSKNSYSPNTTTTTTTSNDNVPIYNNNSNNSSSNSSWNNNNNYGNNNNNYYNNNNSYGNNYGSNYGSNYSNYNNNNTYTTNTRTSYTVNDNSYGSSLVTEDKTTTLTSKSCPYNTTTMMSNYRNNTSIDRFFKNNQKTSQVFIINAQTQNTLKGSNGTIVKIEPNSFVDKNGYIIKGDVEFELKEVYDRASMITSNAHTVCNDVPLISGGELFMGATQGDEPLMLADNKPIAVEMPANSTEPMQLFYGKPDRNTVNWNLANNNSVSPVLNSNSSTGSSYNFSTNSMNWLNCDRFIGNNGSSTKVNVRLPKQYDTTNTAVFIVFAGQNTVTKFDNYTQFPIMTNTVNLSNFDTKWYSVPVGSDVTIVAVSEVNGQYYSSMHRTVLVKDHVEDLVMTPTTLDQFKEDMNKLP